MGLGAVDCGQRKNSGNPDCAGGAGMMDMDGAVAVAVAAAGEDQTNGGTLSAIGSEDWEGGGLVGVSMGLGWLDGVE